MPEASGGTRIEVHFQGPVCWTDSPQCSSIFSDPTAQRSGIYLWTVESDRGHMVFYVGKTSRSFSIRMREHLKEYLSGMYDIYDIAHFRDGRRKRLWEGMWRPGEEVRFPDFFSQHKELWPHLLGMITEIRIHLGAAEEGDKRVLERIEAAVALNLRRQPGSIGDFQNPDIRYRPRGSEESPIKAFLRSDVPILGLPDEIQV